LCVFVRRFLRVRGPATVLEQKLESTKMFDAAKVTLLASLNGYAPALAVEFGLVLYSTERRPLSSKNTSRSKPR
jgi:flagellar motor component MotA